LTTLVGGFVGGLFCVSVGALVGDLVGDFVGDDVSEPHTPQVTGQKSLISLSGAIFFVHLSYIFFQNPVLSNPGYKTLNLCIYRRDHLYILIRLSFGTLLAVMYQNRIRRK
jgi:hypothetical protein